MSKIYLFFILSSAPACFQVCPDIGHLLKDEMLTTILCSIKLMWLLWQTMAPFKFARCGLEFSETYGFLGPTIRRPFARSLLFSPHTDPDVPPFGPVGPCCPL